MVYTSYYLFGLVIPRCGSQLVCAACVVIMPDIEARVVTRRSKTKSGFGAQVELPYDRLTLYMEQ